VRGTPYLGAPNKANSTAPNEVRRAERTESATRRTKPMGFVAKPPDLIGVCEIQLRNSADFNPLTFEAARPEHFIFPNSHQSTFVREFSNKAHWLRFAP
jgi:hypothetical protein